MADELSHTNEKEEHVPRKMTGSDGVSVTIPDGGRQINDFIFSVMG